MLLVLVALDGHGGKRCCGTDALRLSQVAVTRVEAALEQLVQLNLTASLGQAVEILVMYIQDIAIDGLLDLFGQQTVINPELGRLRAVSQHSAHGAVGVDIGVGALHIGILGVHERGGVQNLVHVFDGVHHVLLSYVQQMFSFIDRKLPRRLTKGAFRRKETSIL